MPVTTYLTRREPTEQGMTVQEVPFDEAIRLAKTVGIHIGPSLVLFLCEERIRAALNHLLPEASA